MSRYSGISNLKQSFNISVSETKLVQFIYEFGLEINRSKLKTFDVCRREMEEEDGSDDEDDHPMRDDDEDDSDSEENEIRDDAMEEDDVSFRNA